MKIKYIKDAPNGAAGMSDDVSDFHGNILVKAGFAEVEPDASEAPRKTKAKPKAKAITKTDSE
ncbi:hypothetical protein [Psychrobacter sp. WY6]|uniref:hypothetical protein n=1 Tax=Psychrobacter sp. WY6 TaxID=2708350 RepID=UPI002022E5DD|nr:hypothetical protein [Psychrobacter sp. WY6]